MDQAFWYYAAVTAFIASAIWGMGHILSRRIFKPSVASAIGALGWVALTVFLALRAFVQEGVPGSTLFEILIVIVWALYLGYRAVDLVFQVPSLITFVMPVAASILAVSLLFQGKNEGHIPVGNVILVCHVISAIISYAAFTFGFATGVMYLMQERQLKLKVFGSLFRNLPSLELLDQLNYRTVVFGFPVLSLSLVLGAVIAMRSPDWQPDRLALMAIVTWLVYGMLFSLRLLKSKVQGRSGAYLMVLGFVFICFTFLCITEALHGVG